MELLSRARLVKQRFLKTLLDALPKLTTNKDALYHIGWKVVIKSMIDCFDIDDILGDILSIEVVEIEVGHIVLHGILGFLITSIYIHLVMR